MKVSAATATLGASRSILIVGRGLADLGTGFGGGGFDHESRHDACS
jgi:hypothetical protein